jgi:hypothetical protein
MTYSTDAMPLSIKCPRAEGDVAELHRVFYGFQVLGSHAHVRHLLHFSTARLTAGSHLDCSHAVT